VRAARRRDILDSRFKRFEILIEEKIALRMDLGGVTETRRFAISCRLTLTTNKWGLGFGARRAKP